MTWPEAGDTIAAISTPPGEAGIGIVRLSGPRAQAIARQLFRPRRPRDPWQSHRLYLGHILDSKGHVLDEVLLTLMRAPQTYTREDVVEIHCHSGFAVLKAVLAEVLAQGARLARPGEFTLRAFLAGRLDLSQAEAVLEVIQARTQASLRVAAAHLAGGLGKRLGEVRPVLLHLLARVDAALDFPDEAAELSPQSLDEELAGPLEELEQLLATYQQGRLLREGVGVVLAGRPNVGKSSLLNRLLNTERAIVTDIPGTTRDVIEETISLAGVPLRLSDTAGLREARDLVEELGVARSRERLAQADLILLLVDASEPLSSEDVQTLEDLAARPVLLVLNKIDLPQKIKVEDVRRYSSQPVVEISALTGQGLERLEQAMVDAVLAGGAQPAGEIVTQARHAELLAQAQEALNRGRELLEQPEPPWELLAFEVKEALTALGEITGEEVGDAVLDQIFAEFCIGK
ncbi:MAG: tRNA uridine-5-carboxymethylaminomethyl(34) synthesis GTPase MnmE [Thermodesulfobacteriota bacterium]